MQNQADVLFSVYYVLYVSTHHISIWECEP